MLESGAERPCDEIMRLLGTELVVPLTLMNLVVEERDGFRSCIGIEHTQSPAVTSLCEACRQLTASEWPA
jgi:hypothetical protein